jgi:hypothetical protein
MILIYSEEITPRLKYITQLILNQLLRNEISYTSNAVEFIQSDLPKINYSGHKLGDEIYMKPHGLLSMKELNKVDVDPVNFKNETCFFKSSLDSTFPFDMFAASFYLLTRYEEYFENEKDKFGRFPASESISTKFNLIKKPVVNIWANWLANEITKKYPATVFLKNRFKFISTIDVDNAWAYLNKGFWRTYAAQLKALLKGNIVEFKTRLKVLNGKEKDPYHTYEYLNTIFSGNEEKVKFFFLLGDYAKYDKNVSHKNLGFQQLIRGISKEFDIGIHPSFAGFEKGDYGKVIQEKERLETITGKKIKKSRQHYLNLRFPKTYQNLLKAGIKEDYTMGFADYIGFRAGICTPFYFYDLENETITDLMIVPFQVMDGTLLHYLKYSPLRAWDEIERIMAEVKEVGGTFVSIWHNETVTDEGEWKGYREVFEKMNKLGFKWANEQADSIY